MKWFLFLAGAIIVPPVLFVAAQVAPPQVAPSPAISPKATPAGLLWKPKFVETDPDGSAYLTWNADGQSVQIAPTDRRQNLQWGDCSLPASAGSSIPRKTFSPSPLFEIQRGDAGKSSINIFSSKSKKTLALQNTPWDLFGYDDASESQGWRCQDWKFSANWREVSVVSAGAVYTWSTATGKLLRCVRFDNSKNVSTLFAALSPDCRLVVARMNNQFNGEFVRGGVFDTHTGHKLFNLSSSVDLGVGFSPGGTIFWTSSRTSRVPSDDGQEMDFFDTRTGRLLWHALSFSRSRIKFSPQQRTVIISGEKSLELHDARTGKLQQTLPHPAPYVSDFAPSPDGSQLWATYNNGQIWSWRLR